jgi:hypothetical protein
MGKRVLILITAGLCLIILTSSIKAQEAFPKFNLKLSGGYGKVVGGDLPMVIDDINRLARDQAARISASVSRDLEKSEWGPEFEFEFVYNLNQRFGLGLGIGYIFRKNDTGVELGLGNLVGASLAMEYTSYAIPILLSGYYNVPLGAKTKGYLKAGVGYYFGKLDSRLREEAYVAGITQWEEDHSEASDSGWGFHGSLGFDFQVSKSFALFAEASGRYVKLNNWEGENTYSAAWGSDTADGIFWYAEELHHETGKYYATLLMLPHEPTWAEYRNIRRAEFNFSGYALKLGVRFGF